MSVPDGTFSMGPGTLKIDRRQFHEPIRQNVVARMQGQLAEDQRGIAVLQVVVGAAVKSRLFTKSPDGPWSLHTV